MKRQFIFWIKTAVIIALPAASAHMSLAAQKAVHPEVTEQEKLRPCFECHKTATPKIYTEWFESTHGIANVKCYQCHGTYEDLMKVPDVSACAVCHQEAFGHSEGKPCWECHQAHGFVAKK